MSKPKRWKAPTRRVRRVRTVLEVRCIVCGKWTESIGQRERTTCSASHRSEAHRIGQRGEVPRFAVTP